MASFQFVLIGNIEHFHYLFVRNIINWHAMLCRMMLLRHRSCDIRISISSRKQAQLARLLSTRNDFRFRRFDTRATTSFDVVLAPLCGQLIFISLGEDMVDDITKNISDQENYICSLMTSKAILQAWFFFLKPFVLIC